MELYPCAFFASMYDKRRTNGMTTHTPPAPKNKDYRVLQGRYQRTTNLPL